MSRYGMDFTLTFTVRTDNPNPNALTSDQIADALRERIRDLFSDGPEEIMSACWPPTLFDYEA